QRASPSNPHCRRTLNDGCSGSTNARRASAEVGSFFFEPLQLHLEPTDLLVEFGHLLLLLPALLGRPLEQRLGAVEQAPLPLMHLRGMDAKLAGQFADGVQLLDS